jgi:hypothetical protein
MVLRGRRQMLLRCCHRCCHVEARAAGRLVSPSQGARFAKPAGIIISVSVAEHLERLFRIRYRPITRGPLLRNAPLIGFRDKRI